MKVIISPETDSHMTHNDHNQNKSLYLAAAYTITCLEDEVRIDQLCRELLQEFHQHLKVKDDPLMAGSKAAGTDYFLRDFMIDNQRENIFSLSPERIRAFAGNWYIVSTLEANLKELKSILAGVKEFAQFCHEKEMIEHPMSLSVAAACDDMEYYKDRIDSFHALTGDGFLAWNSACPIK